MRRSCSTTKTHPHGNGLARLLGPMRHPLNVPRPSKRSPSKLATAGYYNITCNDHEDLVQCAFYGTQVFVGKTTALGQNSRSWIVSVVTDHMGTRSTKLPLGHPPAYRWTPPKQPLPNTSIAYIYLSPSDAFGIEKPLSIFSIRIENIDFFQY